MSLAIARHDGPTSARRSPADVLTRIDPLGLLAVLLLRLPDVVFSIKDRAGRYLLMSPACVQRCGLRRASDAIGRDAFDLFPRPMAERYAAQDEHLFATGHAVLDNLDLTVFRDGSEGWCLSSKEPLYDRNGELLALACVSRDLEDISRQGLIDDAFAATIDYMHVHLAEALRVDDLAARAGLSPARFDRRVQRIFGLPVGQYIIRLRVERACELMRRSDAPLAVIAQQTGFSDQSALCRHFRRRIGLSPGQYRRQSARDCAISSLLGREHAR